MLPPGEAPGSYETTLHAPDSERSSLRLRIVLDNLTFGLGTAVLAIAGAAMVPFYYVNPAMGPPLAIKSFMAVVLGGLGSVPGALVGGLVLGVVESVAAQFVPATAAAIFSFVLFAVVLLTRPRGLMGTLEV